MARDDWADRVREETEKTDEELDREILVLGRQIMTWLSVIAANIVILAVGVVWVILAR